MATRVLTVPNQLTFLRLGFLPFFIILVLYDQYGWALAVLILAALTDGLDGLLARGDSFSLTDLSEPEPEPERELLLMATSNRLLENEIAPGTRLGAVDLQGIRE